MLEYNEIKEKKYIVLDGEPYEVLSSHVFRKQQRKPVNDAKLRNLISGKVTERSFHQNEKAEEADISKKTIKYLYNNRGEWWFCEESDPSKRFKLEETLVGDQGKFLKENSFVDGLLFNEEIIGLKLPIKVDLKVTDAPPAVKGNTAQGGNKQVTLETGAVISAPLFINEGDVIRVNTESGSYTERAEKS
ncbi:elongation factor P [bacterium]|nr:elongation factor P [bacterium]|tara:strand:- start:882 stop:1451 length:570 start_codon:yes stop_codon:yes gene_type:complete